MLVLVLVLVSVIAITGAIPGSYRVVLLLYSCPSCRHLFLPVPVPVVAALCSSVCF